MKQSPLLISLCLLWLLSATSAQEDVLFVYAEQGNADQVRGVLAAGANVNAVNLQGDTPLFLALRGNSPEVVRTLIDAGANVAWVNPLSNATAFRLAARNPNRDAIYRMLIDLGAYISISGRRPVLPDPVYEAAFNPVPVPAEAVAEAVTEPATAPVSLADSVNRAALRQAGLSVSDVQAVQQDGIPALLLSLANTSRQPIQTLEVRAVFLRESASRLTEQLGMGAYIVTQADGIPLQPGVAVRASLMLMEAETGAFLPAEGRLVADLYYNIGGDWVNFGRVPLEGQ